MLAIWSLVPLPYHFMANRWGNNVNSDRLYFLGFQITVDSDCSHKIKDFAPWKKSYDKSRQHTKKQRHYFSDKGPYSQSYGFFSSPVQMWGLDHKEDWALKNWCFQTVVLEKTLESPLDCKEIKPVNPKGNQHWKDWCWSWSSNTLVTWWEQPTHWKRPWCWERLKTEEKGGNRGWDGWMASQTQWTWVWANSGR